MRDNFEKNLVPICAELHRTKRFSPRKSRELRVFCEKVLRNPPWSENTTFGPSGADSARIL